MGLDLYHYTLTEKYEPAYDSFFYVEDLEVFPETIKRNEHLITTITEPDKYFEILIFETEQDMSAYKAYDELLENEVALVYKRPLLNTDIAKIEKRYSLDPQDVNTFTTQRTSDRIRMIGTVPFSYTAVSYAMTFVKRKVIYHKELGYQRKGVKPSFYKDFRNDGLYFKKDDVIRLFSYLDDSDQEYYQQRAENCQQNFIDNFVEGDSIFFISW